MPQMLFVCEYVKDCNARRAAEAVGQDPDKAYKMLEEPIIISTLEKLVAERAKLAGLDANWLVRELVDNHRIARQSGSISASNTALGLIGKLASVDAFVSSKLDLSSSDGSMTPIAPSYTPEQLRAAAEQLEDNV